MAKRLALLQSYHIMGSLNKALHGYPVLTFLKTHYSIIGAANNYLDRHLES